MDIEAPEPDEAVALATVIGKNARRLRRDAGLTLDQVSIAARMRGLSWSESRVADFESGRVAPNLATLIAFRLAMADAGCAEATFPELLRSETPIQINDSLFLSKEQVFNLLGIPRSPLGKEALEWLLAQPMPNDSADDYDVGDDQVCGATEERTWKALGISRKELANLSAACGSGPSRKNATGELAKGLTPRNAGRSLARCGRS